ncbi:MAG TPA: MFS transporter, partial [Leifsonia sp.]|nr:MFS transporter [Leifsonia sp.]
MSIPSPAGVGFRSERGPVLISLMLTTGLVAIDSTILATAVPSIVKDLGGFTQFPWLFSVYLLAQAASVPVYAKLSDTIGRKPIVLIGIGLFLIGSILCGFAWSMPALIAFRALQGLGAGAVQPMAVTIAGDIYTVAERAKVQGYLASVWAISSVVGPTLGGVFSQFTSWRWIFFVNVPLCILAGWMLIRNFHEKVEHRKHRIDYAGAILLTFGMSLLILAVLEGGQAWAWDSVWSIGTFVIGGLLLVAFVLVERKAAEPILPLWVFSRRLLVTTTLVSLGVGAVLIGLTSYVPTYLEGTIHVEPIIAGLAVAALTIGWPIAASLSGRFYLRI